jgi:hypothetical protein
MGYCGCFGHLPCVVTSRSYGISIRVLKSTHQRGSCVEIVGKLVCSGSHCAYSHHTPGTD